MYIVTHENVLVVHRTSLCRLKSRHNPSSKTTFQPAARSDDVCWLLRSHSITYSQIVHVLRSRNKPTRYVFCYPRWLYIAAGVGRAFSRVCSSVCPRFKMKTA